MGAGCRGVHWSVIALGALTLSIPDGYSIGAVLLLASSAICLGRGSRPSLSVPVTLYICASIFYVLVWVTATVREDLSLSALDQPLRFIVAIPVLLALWKTNVLSSFAWMAIVVSCLAAAGWAALQVFILGRSRADGIVNTEHFGLVCSVFFGFALAGALWGVLKGKPTRFPAIMLLGAMSALIALGLSGTRAAWLGAFVVFPLFLLTLIKFNRTKAASVALGIGVLMTLGAYFVPQTGLSNRVEQTLTDLNGFSEETHYGSIGRRFEVWRGAIYLWKGSPLVGVGERGFEKGIEELASAGSIQSTVSGFRHAHNDWIDMLTKHGLVGLLVLLAIYGMPFFIFLRGFYVAKTPEVLVASLAGLGLIGNYIVFSMAHQALGSNIGVMTYAFWVPVLIGGVMGELVERSTAPAVDSDESVGG